MRLTGIHALIDILVQLGFIWLAFRALQGIHWERFFRKPPATLPLLIVLCATALGTSCANFFLGILNAISQLTDLLR